MTDHGIVTDENHGTFARRRARPDPMLVAPDWSALYDLYCPEHTDPCSRHAKVICEGLRDPKSPTRKLLADAGYDPDHWASSIELTVVGLWKARAEIAALNGQEAVCA